MSGQTVPDAYIHTAAAAVTHILATHNFCVSTLQIIQRMSIFYTYMHITSYGKGCQQAGQACDNTSSTRICTQDHPWTACHHPGRWGGCHGEDLCPM